MNRDVKKLYEEIVDLAPVRPLSEVLPMLLVVAQDLKDSQLEDWLRLEINGYFDTNPGMNNETRVPTYRELMVNYYDQFGRPIDIPEPLHFVHGYRLRFGVAQLEALSQKQEMIWLQDHYISSIFSEKFSAEVSRLSFSPTDVVHILSGIRTALLEWFRKIQPQLEGLPSSATDAVQGQGNAAPDPHAVFVIHGRNEPIRAALFSFLRSVGLRPLEWDELLTMTNEASPYIGKVLEVAFTRAQAVVALITPDDLAQLRPEFQGANEPVYERNLTGQARPNVLFEMGMAMGSRPQRTVFVQVGDVRPFSDIAGRHVLRLDNSLRQRQGLVQRLETCGCNVNRSGTDWHTEGHFELRDTCSD